MSIDVIEARSPLHRHKTTTAYIVLCLFNRRVLNLKALHIPTPPTARRTVFFHETIGRGVVSHATVADHR